MTDIHTKILILLHIVYYKIYVLYLQYICITTFCTYICTHMKSVDNTRQYHGGLLYVIMAKQGRGVKYTMGDTLTSGLLKVFGSWYSNLLGKDFLPFFG